MKAMLILSLFPGIGLLDRAFEAEGFCVVRGPDLLWGGDIKNFHPPRDRFDGVIGGPPCKAFSSLRFLVEYNGYKLAENLIPEFERIVSETEPRWFLMENVKDAPLPGIGGYFVESFLLNNRWLPNDDGIGFEQNRLRRFSFGNRLYSDSNVKDFIETAALFNPSFQTAVTTSKGNPNKNRIKLANGKYVKALNRGSRRAYGEMCKLQGLPEDFLSEAPFTSEGKRTAVGNGVPIPMGRALAKAIRRFLENER